VHLAHVLGKGESESPALDRAGEAREDAALERAWQAARLKSEREHVTSYIWNNRDQFRTKTLEYQQDLSFLRLSVDEEADFEVVKFIMEELYQPGQLFKLADILRLYEREPAVFKKNINIVRNEGYLKSIAKDRLLTL